jgi:hypothetical protein
MQVLKTRSGSTWTWRLCSWPATPGSRPAPPGCGPPARGTPGNTCLGLPCPHPPKEWSLRRTRGGSVMPLCACAVRRSTPGAAAQERPRRRMREVLRLDSAGCEIIGEAAETGDDLNPGPAPTTTLAGSICGGRSIGSSRTCGNAALSPYALDRRSSDDVMKAPKVRGVFLQSRSARSR